MLVNWTVGLCRFRAYGPQLIDFTGISCTPSSVLADVIACSLSPGAGWVDQPEFRVREAGGATRVSLRLSNSDTGFSCTW